MKCPPCSTGLNEAAHLSPIIVLHNLMLTVRTCDCAARENQIVIRCVHPVHLHVVVGTRFEIQNFAPSSNFRRTVCFHVDGLMVGRVCSSVAVREAVLHVSSRQDKSVRSRIVLCLSAYKVLDVFLPKVQLSLIADAFDVPDSCLTIQCARERGSISLVFRVWLLLWKAEIHTPFITSK